MKTPFETLLARRAEAMQNARCPYSPEELDSLISRAVRQATSARSLPFTPTYRSWPRRFLPAASVATLLFVATYTLAPPSSDPPLRPMASYGYNQTLDSVAMVLNTLSKTYLA